MSSSDYNSGPGYYGPKTKAAVLKFQKANGVNYGSYPGYWGPKSIAAANSMSSSSSSNNGSTVTRSNTSSSNDDYATTTNQTVTRNSSENGQVWFNTDWGPVYKGASVKYKSGKITWTNPDGSYIWVEADVKSYPGNAQFIKDYSPYYSQVTRDYDYDPLENSSSNSNTNNTQQNSNTQQNTNTNTNTSSSSNNNTSNQTSSQQQIGFPNSYLEPSQVYNPQVEQLQRYLISQGALSESQVGGNWGYYGPVTTAAVKSWQEANGVDNSTGPGYWGPKSIAKANQIYSSQSSSSNNNNNTGSQNTGSQYSYQVTPGDLYQMIQPGGSLENVDQSVKNQVTQLYNSWVATGSNPNIKTTFHTDQQIPNLQIADTQTPIDQPDSTTGQDGFDWGSTTGGDYSTTGGTPYMMGNYSLVRFAGTGPRGSMDDGTIWLMDPSTQTLRPFENASSLQNFFDGPVDISKIEVVSAAELMPGGLLGPKGDGAPGYELLSNDYAIKSDGTARELKYSASQLQGRYGQGINQDLEEESWLMLKGMFDQFEQGGISSGTINDVRNDDTQLAFYINSLAYGGYSITDVYRDIKAREIGSDQRPISATSTKAEYKKTDEYQQANTDQAITPPDKIGVLDTSGLEDLAVYNLPEEIFKTLIPILDYDSQEFQDAMDAVETSYYDLLDMQLGAQTDQEKAIADYQWNQFREDLEKNYGIALSDNAIDAWGQIEAAQAQFAGQRNIANSGLQNEAIDDYLKRVRKQDQRVRDEETDKKTKEEMTYYLGYATPEQIKALVDSDPEKAKSWGLLPSDEVMNQLTLSKLKQKYPEAKEEDLQLYISAILDENGNYRSNLYQKQMGNLLDLASPNLSTTLGIQTSREEFQRQEALRKSLLEEEDAYKEFTKPDVAFLRNVDRTDSNQQPYLPSESNDTEDFSERIKQAGYGIEEQQINRPQQQQQSQPASSSSAFNTARQQSQQTYTPPTATDFKVTGTGSQYTPTSTSPTVNQSSNYNMSTPSGPVYAPPPTTYSQPATPSFSPMPTTHANSTPSVLPQKTGTTTGVVSAIKNAGKSAWNKLTSWF